MASMNSQQNGNSNAPQQSSAAANTTRRRRNAKPFPVPGCTGDASERHATVHTLDCRVPYCEQQGHVFECVADLGRHLVEVHNEGEMDGCHWPGCTSNGRRKSRTNHTLHLRLHNHRLPTAVGTEDEEVGEDDAEETVQDSN